MACMTVHGAHLDVVSLLAKSTKKVELFLDFDDTADGADANKQTKKRRPNRLPQLFQVDALSD